MTKIQSTQTGTVIQGTFITKDVIAAFVDHMLLVHPETGMGLQRLYAELPDTQDEDDWFLYGPLWSAMESISPDGHWFGAHPGNSSDFGYWENGLEFDDVEDLGEWLDEMMAKKTEDGWYVEYDWSIG